VQRVYAARVMNHRILSIGSLPSEVLGAGLCLALVAWCLVSVARPHIASAQSNADDTAVMPDWAISAHSQALQMPLPEKITVAPIPPTIPQSDTTADSTGSMTTFQPAGPTTTSDNAFFQSLGTNGRSCFSCHEPQDGWAINPSDVTARFNESQGTDPLFSPIDGATCPDDKVATLAQRKTAYKLLLGRGLIRISLPMPSAAELEFSITKVKDPYGCNTNPKYGLTSPTTGFVSVYRRPLPATNLTFESTLMWDGREPSLSSQATDATLIHAQSAEAPSADQLQQIVDFETGTFTGQTMLKPAGDLTSAPVSGGPVALSTQDFFIGINDPFGNNPMGTPFNPDIFNLYPAWQTLKGKTAAIISRESIARGEILFNTFPLTITAVPGLNDVTGQASINGTCGTCHDTPNTGGQSVSGTMALDADLLNHFNASVINESGLPVFTLQCDSGPLAGQTFVTTDPGRALITGKCVDIGKFKVPSMRGLAARAPYFHNGSAATLGDVVEFYGAHFMVFFSPEQQYDLVSFMNSL
jgi:cytochrome c peroxidase